MLGTDDDNNDDVDSENDKVSQSVSQRFYSRWRPASPID